MEMIRCLAFWRGSVAGNRLGTHRVMQSIGKITGHEVNQDIARRSVYQSTT